MENLSELLNCDLYYLDFDKNQKSMSQVMNAGQQTIGRETNGFSQDKYSKSVVFTQSVENFDEGHFESPIKYGLPIDSFVSPMKSGVST